MPNKHDLLKDHPRVIAIKKKAHSRRQDLGIGASKALEIEARQLGFKSYAAFRADIRAKMGDGL